MPALATHDTFSYSLYILCYHPSLPPSSQEHADGMAFARMARAYEVLKDSEARENYDYMLAHPGKCSMDMK